MLGKALGINSGRRNDHLEVLAFGKNPLEVAQQKVNIDRALMGLVNDDGVIVPQKRIGLRFRKQNAVGHQLDGGSRHGLVGKAHLVAHHLAHLGVQLLRNALGDGTGGNASGLRVSDHALDAAPGKQTKLRKLRCFAGTRLAADDDHLMA